jgi:uncharacterized protein
VTLYVDSSALLKRYVAEADSPVAERLLQSDRVLVTSWITLVEVRRNLARLLTGADRVSARQAFVDDLEEFALVTCDEATADAASRIAETLGVRSLDAIHLASAQRLQIPGLSFVTFDLRQGQAARSLGFTVLGC